MVRSLHTRLAVRSAYPLAFAAACALTVVAAVGTNVDGADFEWQTSSPLDALVRGDFHTLGVNFPLMGPVSLLLRAPFDWLVNDANIRVVYLVTSLPCIAAFAAAIWWLKRLVEARQGHSVAVAVAILAGLNLAAIRAIHWGHPEDLLCVALILAAALAAPRLHWLVTAALLGLALATKQWALLALLPIMLAAGAHRIRIGAVALALAALITLPFAVQAPSRFKDIAMATSNTEAFWHKGQAGQSGSRVTPPNIVWPFAERRHEQRAGLFVESAVVGAAPVKIMHVLIGLLVLPLCWFTLRMQPRAGPDAWLGVLAAIFLLRCLLDPVNFDYYQLTAVVCLAAWEGLARRGMPVLTLLAVLGIAVTWAAHVRTFAALYQHALWMNVTYLLWMLPLLYALLRAQLSSRSYAGSVRNSVSSSESAVATNSS